MIVVFVMIGMDSETFVLLVAVQSSVKVFSTLISVCQISSRRFCALRLTLPECQTLLLVCVYICHFWAILNFKKLLMSWKVHVIDLQDRNMLAVVSDFIVDFSHTDRCHTNGSRILTLL